MRSSQTKVKDCVFCQEIDNLLSGKTNAYFVIKLKTGYVSFAYNQYYEGYCLFISNVHFTELHQLNSDLRKQFLFEMSLVSEAIYKTFNPTKLNIELLGNSHPHLHWHIIPRYKNDALPKIPVWNNQEFLKNKIRLSESKLALLKRKLLKGLNKVLQREGF